MTKGVGGNSPLSPALRAMAKGIVAAQEVANMVIPFCKVFVASRVKAPKKGEIRVQDRMKGKATLMVSKSKELE